VVHQLADIRPEERRGAGAAFVTMLGTLAGHTLLETARDALFLARLPPSQLPWAYLAIALLAVAISQGPWRPTGRGVGRYGISLVLVATGAVTLGFWLLSAWQSAWALRALYVWTGLVGTLTGLQFWIVMGELYTVTQAKRLYKLIGTGSLLGAVLGAGAAREIASRLGPEPLVLAAALTLVATGVGPALLVRRPSRMLRAGRSSSLGSSLRDSVVLLRSQPYLRNLAGLVLAGTVALTLTDYIFKSYVAQNVPAEQLGPFFALVYGVLNLLALLSQVFLVGALLRTLGLHRSLWVLPALLFLGAAGVALGVGVAAALFLKGADGTLRHSLHRTTTELLFVPLPDGLRSRAKPFIDVVGQRGGQALASLFILTELGLGRGNAVLSLVLAGLALLWIVLAAEMRGNYLDLFRAALREGAIRDSRELPEVDLNSLEALFAALNSSDDTEVIGAMEYLADQERTRLIPALILYHPSRPVALRAFELFEKSGREDFLPIADRLLDHDDGEIRAAALRARTTIRPDEAVLRAAQSDPSPLVRSTALVGLIAGGWQDASLVAGLGGPAGTGTVEACVAPQSEERPLRELVRSGASVEGCIALARAVRRQPSPVFRDVLLHMADSADEQLQREVAWAMAAAPIAEFLPALLQMLGTRGVRGAARAALVAQGDAGLELLGQALVDERLPLEIRRHLPRTIALFPPQAAVALLESRVREEPDGAVRFKLISALGRLVTDHPGLALDQQVLDDATADSLVAAFRMIDWRLTLQHGARDDPRRATGGHDLLVTLLRDKERQVLERIFRFLDLRLRDEDLKRIYRGLRSTSPKVRANSRELLENLLPERWRPQVLALVDDGSDGQKLALAAPFYLPRRLDYESLLATLLEEQSETIRSITAHHVGELGLVSLRPRLEGLESAGSGFFLSRVVQRTLRLLGKAGGEVVHAR
jgi:hypothetical protein